MTVKELRHLLADWPDHLEVIVSHDAEGNEFSPLHEVQQGEYTPMRVHLTNDQRGKNQKTRPALILWPM